MTIADLMKKKNEAVLAAREILDRADGESRSMTDEENTNFDRAIADSERYAADIEKRSRLDALEAQQNESRGRITRPETRTLSNYGDALRGWLLDGTEVAPSPEQRSAMADAGFIGRSITLSLHNEPLRSIEWESRAQSTSTTAGGYTIAESFANRVELGLRQFGGMRTVSSVLRTATGAPMPWPSTNDTAAGKGYILSENTGVTEKAIVFGSKTFGAYKYSSGLVTVSTELLNDSAVDLPSLIGSLLGERIARAQNTDFTTGDGDGEPFGLITDATNGVTSASTSVITYDEVLSLYFSVDAAYRANATWMMSDSALAAIAKLKNESGDPLWMPNVSSALPGTLFGRPYVVNNDMASIAASAKVIAFGDMTRYKIRDVNNVSIVRLDERYAELGQVAFLGFHRADGALLDAGTHPVKLLTMKSA